MKLGIDGNQIIQVSFYMLVFSVFALISGWEGLTLPLSNVVLTSLFVI